MVEPGALEQWITTRIGAYTAPARRGVPRGQAVGFSAAKFRAAAYSLSARSLADVAAASGITYGQLTVWRTHADFRARVAHLADAFVADLRAGITVAVATNVSPVLANAVNFGEPVRGALHRLLAERTEATADGRLTLAQVVLRESTMLGRPLWLHACAVLGDLAREYLIFVKGRSAAHTRAIDALDVQGEALATAWIGCVEDAALAAEFAALSTPPAVEEATRRA